MSKELEVQWLKPASFNNGVRRETQTTIIVDLIRHCIAKEKIITIDDILKCWFKADHRHSFISWYRDSNGESKYRVFWPTQKKEIMKHCRSKAEARARQWFMSNLGAAIIKGKLLVIPVIDLPELPPTLFPIPNN